MPFNSKQTTVISLHSALYIYIYVYIYMCVCLRVCVCVCVQEGLLCLAWIERITSLYNSLVRNVLYRIFLVN